MKKENKIKSCFLCNSIATSVEHVPAKCFFPEDKRINLITVPSCSKHNEDTSLDDQYIQTIIAMTKGGNTTAVSHFLHKGVAAFRKTPGLEKLITRNPKFFNFIKDDESTKNLTYEVDRIRFDRVVRKIAYGLHFHKFKIVWNKELAISTGRLVGPNNEPDPVFEGLKKHVFLSANAVFEGNNPDVFKYTFISFPSRKENFILMNFYEAFDVWAIPVEGTSVPNL
ncbi:MAG TPA: hypothetical protein VIL78_09525 [Hanamia sp.]